MYPYVLKRIVMVVLDLVACFNFSKMALSKNLRNLQSMDELLNVLDSCNKSEDLQKWSLFLVNYTDQVNIIL